jgi:hypothetical protein
MTVFDIHLLKPRMGDTNSLSMSISFEFRVEATKHFAKMPVRLTNGRLVWLKPYYKLWNRFMLTAEGKRVPEGIIDENEFLVKMLKDEIYIQREIDPNQVMNG